MIKKNKKQTIDMAWGSPSFLDFYWHKKRLPQIERASRTKNYAVGSRKLLRSKIKNLHKKVKNAETKDRHIVVAAGATQIILGLFHVLREEAYGCSAYAQPPHFSRFPMLANLSNLDWYNDRLGGIKVVTNPNNPDGRVSNPTEATILDLCYNWPQYTDVIMYDHPIMVFSLSKATGHANTRIGWALIKDKVIAKKLEHYIEVSTGGLSIDSQVKAEKIIETQLRLKNTVFSYGKKILDSRWDRIKKIKHLLPFEVLNESGMFLWAKGTCPEYLISLKGEASGGTYENFRLNIGCSERKFKAALKLLVDG